MKFQLGRYVFESKEKARAEVRRILHNSELNKPLEDRVFETIKDLISHHPSAAEKIGVGISSICVIKQEMAPYSRVFKVTRLDGTTVKFSYKKCFELYLSKQKSKALQAMRQAVKEQVINAKHWYFEVESDESNRVFSSVENRWLSWQECELDHYPKPFSVIVEEFLTHHQITFDDIEVAPHHSEFGDVMANRIQADLWRGWHEQHAGYRIISAALNNKLGNRGQEYA